VRWMDFSFKWREYEKSRIASGFLFEASDSYMFSIMTSPNPEHDTWLAPSISRAKS
jgi:hypothetical protein